MMAIRQKRKLQHVQVAVAVSKANPRIVCVRVSSVVVGDQARQLFLGVEEGRVYLRGKDRGQGLVWIGQEFCFAFSRRFFFFAFL